MKRICYCYIHEPAPERQAPRNEPFRKTDQAYIAALRRALATSYPDWELEVNHKGESWTSMISSSVHRASLPAGFQVNNFKRRFSMSQALNTPAKTCDAS